MERTQQLFLEAVGAAVAGERVSWAEEVSRESLARVLQMAQVHRVLPMAYQAVHECPAWQQMAPELQLQLRRQVRQLVALQARKTAEFLPVLEALGQADLRPLVVKGLMCRRLYPQPDQRISADEDLLIPAGDFDRCRRVLEGLGMVAGGEDGYEVPFTRPGSAQLLEVHRSLFPPEHAAYGDLNRFFADAHSQAIQVDGILTLPHSQHLLYLILHAYKHFLHSGFGIRQVCDIICYANIWGSQIDWEHMLRCLQQVRGEKFAAAIFRIGRRYLRFDQERARYPLRWQSIPVDEGPLLADILEAGLYGDADLGRKHSSTITLRAVADKGKSPGRGILRSVFPKARELEGRYPYLKGKPFLLPVAWTTRLLKYGRETASTANNDPGRSIRIGTHRVELLRKYGILEE